MNITILLVDDHPTLRDGLRQAIAQRPHLRVVGEAPTGELAVKLALKLTPDVVVMDIHLLKMNGLDATRQILSALPATKIVIFSSDAAGGYVTFEGRVRNLNEDWIPEHLDFVKSFLTRRPMNFLFPISITLATVAAVHLVQSATAEEA